MSIYLYSLRATTVGVKTATGLIRANSLEMLHTNWRGMADESDCPRSHRLAQVNAEKYWARQSGLPFYAILGNRVEGKLYRWTGKDCFWIDTDRIPGDFMGDVKDGILIPHDCADHSRVLYCTKITCGGCLKTLEARPGEIDAIRAKDVADREADRRKQAQRDAIWAKVGEQVKLIQGLARKNYDLRSAVNHWEAQVTKLSNELTQSKVSLTKVQEMKVQAEREHESAEAVLSNLQEIARTEEAKLNTKEEVSATDC